VVGHLADEVGSRSVSGAKLKSLASAVLAALVSP
jgi:hypothetical protein